MRTLLISLFIICFNAYGETLDFIDIKESCEVKSIERENNLKRQSTNDNLDNEFNSDYRVTVQKIDHESQTIYKEVLVINNKDLFHICNEFQKTKNNEIELKALFFDPGPINKDTNKWRVVFTFGPFLAYHHKMDMKIQNDETNATISGLQPIQRHGLHHYQLIGPNTGHLKFIDEPQNRITVELVNKKMFVGLEYNHPKILFQDQYATPDNNENISINGVLAGEEINESNVALRNYIYQIQASHGNTNINAFAGKVFNLIGKQINNNLEFHIGGGAGVSFANGVTKYFYVDDDGVQKLNITENNGMKIYGYNLNGKARIRHNFLNGNMNASLTYDGIYTRFDGPLGGFDVEGNLYSHHIGISIGMRLDHLFNKKNKNKRRRKK